MSTCRGTYASPDTQTPLCHAAPSLMVSLPEICQACQYQQFRKNWESRISEAQDKQQAAGELFADMSDIYGTSAAELGDGSDYMMEDDGLGFGDAELAMRERRNAEAEVDRLTTQFERELWKQWKPFLLGSDRPRRSRRERRPSPKCNGSSPLKTVTAQDDIPVEDVPTFDDDDEDDYLGRVSTESTSGFNSEADSGASSPTGLVSIDSVFPENPIGTNWAKPRRSSQVEHDAMLPNWAFSA